MQKREETKREKFVILSLIFIILISASVSAGWFDWIKTMTGRAASKSTNVSVPISGTDPISIELVSVSASINPSEGNPKDVTIYIKASDTNGVADINDTSFSANFTKSGQPTRENSSCVWIEDLDANSANYSCTITMWYWDESGTWNIGVKGRDYGSGSWSHNTTQTFTYNELKALVISPDEIAWSSISPGATDQDANNDPTTVNNTGNYNQTTNAINVTAINLIGESVSTVWIDAANFTVHTSSGSECGGIPLQNATQVTITMSDSNPGNLSAGGGVGQETIYYCIPNVPNIQSQTYSTTAGGSWTISF